MDGNKSDNQKRRGRPATGSQPMWGVRFNELQRDAITMWARARKISRAEAIRQLVERGVFAQR